MAEWLKGCEICNAGLCAEMDNKIASGMSEREAARHLAGQAKEKIGTELYTQAAIRNKYQYHKGKKKVAQNEPVEFKLASHPHIKAAIKSENLKKNIEHNKFLEKRKQQRLKERKIPPDINKYTHSVMKDINKLDDRLRTLKGNTQYIDDQFLGVTLKGDFDFWIERLMGTVRELRNELKPDQKTHPVKNKRVAIDNQSN